MRAVQGERPAFSSKKTGAYRHRECPDEATARELLREERRAARAAARGSVVLRQKRPRRGCRALGRRVGPRGVLRRDGATPPGATQSASGTPVSSRDRQIRRRARVAEDASREVPSEDSGEDRIRDAAPPVGAARAEAPLPDVGHRDASRHREAAVSSIRAPRIRARVGRTIRCRDRHAWRGFGTCTKHVAGTFLVFGAALAVVLVSRSSVSAAIALADAASPRSAPRSARRSASRTPRALLSSPGRHGGGARLGPGPARVLEASASAAVVFTAGLFTTLAAALVDAARELSRRRTCFLRASRRSGARPRRDDGGARRGDAGGGGDEHRRERGSGARARLVSRRNGRTRDGEEDETAQDTHTPKRTPRDV